MIIDTEGRILAFKGNEFIGEVSIINIKEHTLIINDKEYKFDDLTIYNELELKESLL